jgi:predicted nuclease of predicted toxin-antitoxin system
MLFFADEDFPGLAVRWLREAGHDVVWARTAMPGDADASLLAAAQRDFRVILTCDKDFGELAFHRACRRRAGSCCSGSRRLHPRCFFSGSRT